MSFMGKALSIASSIHSVEIAPKDWETNKDLKSILLSGTKYIYIIIITAFLSGIFTPLTIGVEIEDVIFGMLTIFLGLGGGVLMFLAIKKSSMKIFFGGLGIIIAAFILIHELSGRPLL